VAHSMTKGTPRMTGLDTHEDKMAFTMTGKMECKKCHVERSETSFTLERFSAKDPSLTLRMTEWAHSMTEGTHRMTGQDTHEDKMAFTMTGKAECKKCHVERSETSFTLELQ